MLPTFLVKTVIPAIESSMLGYFALNIMDEYKVSHLPIVNDGIFLNLICETDLFNNDLNEPISKYNLTLSNACIKNTAHLFDAIRLSMRLKLSVIPVVDNYERYLGNICSNELLYELGNILSIDSPGAILEIEINSIDYQLSEITRLIESLDIKILNTSACYIQDSTLIKLTIKVNKVDITSLIQTLNRFEYKIVEHYGIDENNEFLIDRYNLLMNYLKI